MKRVESIFREILYQAMEQKEAVFTQSELSKKLGISLSIVNSAVKKLENMGAVKIKTRSFQVIDIRKVLYYWASIRDIRKDIIFKARIELPVREIERIMPNVIFTAYTAFKLNYNDVPADYSEIYVYADESQRSLIKERIEKIGETNKAKVNINSNNSNVFVLKKDSNLDSYGHIPLAQVFVDLWNLKEWYAKEFLKELENKIKLDFIKGG